MVLRFFFVTEGDLPSLEKNLESTNFSMRKAASTEVIYEIKS